MADEAALRELLSFFPQKPPFLFVDELLEVSPTHALGRHLFKGDEQFYQGHFPGHPITPGVILLEMMCQVSQAIYLHRMQADRPLDPRKGPKFFFTGVEVEFHEVVPPGSLLTSRSELLYLRLGRARSKNELRFADGRLVATSTSSGMLAPED